MLPVDDLRKTYPDATERNVIPPMVDSSVGPTPSFVVGPSLAPAAIDLATTASPGDSQVGEGPALSAHIPFWLKASVVGLGVALVATALVQLPRTTSGPAVARIPATLEIRVESAAFRDEAARTEAGRPNNGP